MYNRYVPQPDGSYRRNRIQDAQRPASAQAQQQAVPDACPNIQFPQKPTSSPPYNSSNSERPAPRRNKAAAPASVGSFLRQLLPGNFDTEDLLVVILLLLMAGDCEEDRSNALLTLALYLFL